MIRDSWRGMEIDAVAVVVGYGIGTWDREMVGGRSWLTERGDRVIRKR